jgi:arylsulfatase
MKMRPSPQSTKQPKSKRPLKKWLSRTSLLLLASSPFMYSTTVQAADERPNIVLLVADDVGFSDFSRFGGEAVTPMMDNFSQMGMTLTNFHVLPTCSPSRSAFLTGVDNHLNGMGTMQGQLKNPRNKAKLATQVTQAI